MEMQFNEQTIFTLKDINIGEIFSFTRFFDSTAYIKTDPVRTSDGRTINAVDLHDGTLYCFEEDREVHTYKGFVKFDGCFI